MKRKKRVFEINVCCLICTYNKLQKKSIKNWYTSNNSHWVCVSTARTIFTGAWNVCCVHVRSPHKARIHRTQLEHWIITEKIDVNSRFQNYCFTSLSYTAFQYVVNLIRARQRFLLFAWIFFVFDTTSIPRKNFSMVIESTGINVTLLMSIREAIV